MAARYEIRDDGDYRKYFTQTPNIVDDMELSVYAFRLYFHLRRVAGDNGECWQSVDTLSKSCRMSAGMITKSRNELVKAGLIKIDRKDNPRGGRDFFIIALVDLWKDNYEKYKATSLYELASSPDELASSPHEVKNNPVNKNPIKNNKKKISGDAAPRKSAENSGLYSIAMELSLVTGMDFEKNKSRLFREAKAYKPDEIEQIKRDYGEGGEWYRQDWRGLRGQCPTLETIRATWNKFTHVQQNKKSETILIELPDGSTSEAKS